MAELFRKPAIWILCVIGLMCLCAPLLATHSPRRTNLELTLADPSSEHWLGTDFLGRDIYSRLLYGGRQTLAIAIGATVIAAALGTLFGMLALIGGKIGDAIIGSMLDAWLAVPPLLIALVVMTLTGKGAGGIMLAVGIASIGTFARTTRDALQSQRNLPYIESAISIGATPQHILIHYMLRNALPILVAFAGVTFSWALLNGAALAFLGFIGNPSVPDWGIMLAAGRQTFAIAPYEALAAGFMLTLTVSAVNRLSS